MITKIPAHKRHLSRHGWLSTYLLFSFANYYDPENLGFGNLRVFNDDTIAAHSGFGEHEHDNMEIVTIVHEGVLTHRDSMGNTGTITAGEVQYMSAGTGVAHAEMNDGDVPVHLYQIWLYPRQPGLMPRYEQKDFSNIQKNMFVPVASGQGKPGALTMQADATIFTAELDAGMTIEYALENGRGLFVYVREGMLVINGQEFGVGDQARIVGKERVVIIVPEAANAIIIEVAI